MSGIRLTQKQIALAVECTGDWRVMFPFELHAQDERDVIVGRGEAAHWRERDIARLMEQDGSTREEAEYYLDTAERSLG